MFADKDKPAEPATPNLTEHSQLPDVDRELEMLSQTCLQGSRPGQSHELVSIWCRLFCMEQREEPLDYNEENSFAKRQLQISHQNLKTKLDIFSPAIEELLSNPRAIFANALTKEAAQEDLIGKLRHLQLLVDATSPNGLARSLNTWFRIAPDIVRAYSTELHASTGWRTIDRVTELSGCSKNDMLKAPFDERLPLLVNRSSMQIANCRPKGISWPFIVLPIHESLSIKSFNALDHIPLLLAEVTPHRKASDGKPEGRTPNDLFDHDVHEHGKPSSNNFFASNTTELIESISLRLEFAKELESRFESSIDLGLAQLVRFGLHHEGWFGKITKMSVSDRLPEKRFFSWSGPWTPEQAEPRHSLGWYAAIEDWPISYVDRFLNDVGDSLASRCNEADLGLFTDSERLPMFMREYWEFVKEFSKRKESEEP